MNRLLKSASSRMLHFRLFWISNIFMMGMSVFQMMKQYSDLQLLQREDYIDRYLYSFSVFGFFTVGIVCAFFVGTDYSDGTIRNKIVAGYKRYQIYLSNFIVGCFVAVMNMLFFMVPQLIIGAVLGLQFELSASANITRTIVGFLMMIALVAIMTFTASLCNHKAGAATMCILLACLFCMSGAIINSKLNENPYVQVYKENERGEEVIELVKNYGYLEGTPRKILEVINDINPGGQAFVIGASGRMADFNQLMGVYDALLVLGFVGLGCVLIEKKELK